MTLITIHRLISVCTLSLAALALDPPQGRLAEEFRNLDDMIESKTVASRTG